MATKVNDGNSKTVFREGVLKKGGLKPDIATSKPPAPSAQKPQSSQTSQTQSTAQTSTGQSSKT